jgi:putative transposase
MKYRFIHQHRFEHRVWKLCRVLKVSRSGYYRWLKAPISKRTKSNERLLKAIRDIHSDTDMESYGSPRVANELRNRGFNCSKPRVARLMRDNGIRAKIKRKFKVTTNSNHTKKRSPNLLEQKFTVIAPHEIWVSELTYIRTGEGWLYLTAIMDLFDRRIVGWSMSERMHSKVTAEKALHQAWLVERPSKQLIFHSDQGVQYATDDFRKALSQYSFVQSMGGKGNCYDNAVAESFFKTLKTELVYKSYYRTRIEARQSIFRYIETFYNRRRQHSFLDYMSPEMFRNAFFDIKNAA